MYGETITDSTLTTREIREASESSSSAQLQAGEEASRQASDHQLLTTQFCICPFTTALLQQYSSVFAYSELFDGESGVHTVAAPVWESKG